MFLPVTKIITLETVFDQDICVSPFASHHTQLTALCIRNLQTLNIEGQTLTLPEGSYDQVASTENIWQPSLS